MDSISDWGIPSKVFVTDKPINLGDFHELDTHVSDFTCEVEPTRLDTLADMVAQESVDNGHFVADPSSHTISFEVNISPKQMRNLRKILRQPKLPRKLKKRVKKTCLSEPPKRVPRMVLNYAFAMNHPHLAHKVGLKIEKQLTNE